RVPVVLVAPQLPGLAPGPAVIADDELALRVDRVLARAERELEELALGDRLGRARLDAEVAVDAPEAVDLVHVAVALARRGGCVGRVVGAADVDALRRAHARTELTADALLHAVLVAVEDVAAVRARRLRALLLGELLGDLGAADLSQRDREPAEPAHQRISST